MKKTKIQIDAGIFPPKIQELFKNATVYDSSCHSDATVYYLDSGCYVKTDSVHALAHEAEMCKLFYSLGLGVELVCYVSADKDYLVTREALGEDLTHFLDNPEELCKLLATSLKHLHSLPADGIPISPKNQHYISVACGDFSTGSFEDYVLMDKYPINSKEEALEIIQDGKSLFKADTVIHGDACLPNLIHNSGTFSAFIDFSLSGRGDKHIDLYWALWSLKYNLKTEKYSDLFLDFYGRESFDENMLRVIAAYEYFG